MVWRSRRYTEAQFRETIANSKSIAEVIRRLGLGTKGQGNYFTMHRLITKLGLDTSHFTGQAWSRGRNLPKRDIQNYLVLNKITAPTINSGKLRERLVSEGLLKNECYDCGRTRWRDKPLRLQIDHINGNRWDNRIENLRILCPNCHSNTPTFGIYNPIRYPHTKLTTVPDKEKLPCQRCGNPLQGKQRKFCSTTCRYPVREIKTCFHCHKLLTRNQSKFCSSQCYHESTKGKKHDWGRKVSNRPSLEEIIQTVQETSWQQTAKRWGVSNNCIRKWVRSYGADPKSIQSGSKYGPKPKLP